MPVDRFHRAQLLGRTVYWLLTLRFDSQDIHLSTADLLISEASTGRTLQFAGRLTDFQPARQVGLFKVAEIASVPVEVALPQDIAARVFSAGHRFAGASAEISRWIEGTDYDDRRVELVGQVKDPQIGEKWEPVGFSIEANAWEDDKLIPPDGQKVDENTWIDSFSSLMPEEAEIAYPIIYGFPGRTTISSTIGALTAARGWIAGSQGVWVDHRTALSGSDFINMKLVLAGHRVAADRVMLVTDDYSAGRRFVVQHSTDDLGNPIAFVDAQVDGSAWSVLDGDGITAFGLGSNALHNSYQPTNATITEQLKPVFAGWYDPSDNTDHQSGGKIGRTGKVIRGAGEVIEDVLSYTGKPIDRGSFAAQAPLLDWLKIDCTIDGRTKPWPWLQDHIFPIAPVSITSGPKGLQMIVWQVTATADKAIATIDVDADPRIERASRMRLITREIKNNFVLRYAYNVRTESYLKERRLGGADYDVSDPNTRPSTHCAISQRRYQFANGTPRVVTFSHESMVLYDDASVAGVQGWWAAAHALEKGFIDYVLPDEWDWLKRGDVVLLKHGSMGLSSRVFHVFNVEEYANGTIGVTLLRFGDPTRDLVSG